MRIYVAGRTSEIEKVQMVQERLKAHGHDITFDWTSEEEGEVRADWSAYPGRAAEISGLERRAIEAADAVVLVGYGCDEQSRGGLGCFIEVGMALALETPVVIWGPARESVFWYSTGREALPLVDRAAHIGVIEARLENLVDALREEHVA